MAPGETPEAPGASGNEPPESARVPGLEVTNPSGNRNRMPVSPLPFLIGRQGDNHLVLRDNRISRNHARIVTENGGYFLEDLDSLQGVYVNGQRVTRQQLNESDRIDFGLADSYRLVFSTEASDLNRVLHHLSPPVRTGSNLSKLRSLVEVARALQSSLSHNDVLAAVVDAALAVTGAERGFLLIKGSGELDVQVARDHHGAPLASSDLQVPRSLILRALHSRRELLSMTFDPAGEAGVRPETSVADLDLRSVVCVPLVRVRLASSQETIAASAHDTLGLLYMDSRISAADLSLGNREILQTLALEASTILENARLLAEEREKQRLEEELNIARTIQRDLLPNLLPCDGWFRACGSSIASRQVGGDYFDVRPAGPDGYACTIADVSGKGVSAALLAALLQGAFSIASGDSTQVDALMVRVNHFLNERAQGEKYATVFFCTIQRNGELRWANAGHPKPVLVRTNGELVSLDSTGMPLGLLDAAAYETKSMQLEAGDKIVLYSDGLSEAENGEGQFFDPAMFRDVLRKHAVAGSIELHDRLVEAVNEFTEDAEPTDDITTLVLEYRP
jgi:sigma-B regulation protein RsbU (phosphoserine phosphatase)